MCWTTAVEDHRGGRIIERIAIIADIHGNLPALQAALEQIARQQVDQLIIAGDVVNGAPDSAACLELALSLGCPILRGNHERYVFDYGSPQMPALWATEQFGPVHWTYQQLSAAQRDLLRALPPSYIPPGAPDILVVHASARSDNDTLQPSTPETLLRAMFPEVRQQLLVRAHNHVQQVRIWEDRLIVTTGSVGLPLDSNPVAQYLLLERRRQVWRILHQATPYDLQAALRRFHETGYLEASGPMGRLIMREVQTASFQLVPFLRLYEQWKAQGLSLAAAVERFLAL